jgi:hypothetical protein
MIRRVSRKALVEAGQVQASTPGSFISSHSDKHFGGRAPLNWTHPRYNPRDLGTSTSSESPPPVEKEQAWGSYWQWHWVPF